MADIKSLIDKFNIFRTKDSILNDVAKDNGQITIDIKQPFSDDIDSNNSLKTKLETNIKDKLFNTEINNVGSNIFDEKIKPFDKGYNVSNTPDTDTKTPIDTTTIKPDTPTIEKNSADATAIQQEKTQQPEITTQEPEPEATQQYKTIIIQKKPKLTTDSLGNYMPIDYDKRKGTAYSGVGEQQIDELYNILKDDEKKFDMFMGSVYEALDQLKSKPLNDTENIIFLPFSFDHENGNMNGARLRFGLGQKEWAEKQLKTLATKLTDKQNEEWLSNLKLPEPKTTMDKITSNPWGKLLSFMQPPTNEMEPESASKLESGQQKNRLNAIKWRLIDKINECKKVFDKYYGDKSQVGTALSKGNIAETIYNILLPKMKLAEDAEIALILKKSKENPKGLTPIENEIVNYSKMLFRALSVIDSKTTTGYKTTKSILNSLPFMADFFRANFVGGAIRSGIRGGTRTAMKLGGKSAEREIAKDVTKNLVTRAGKFAGDIGKSAVHTTLSPLTPQNMLENYSQTIATKQPYTKNDLIRGGIEAFTENFSERMFGALKGILPKSNNALVNSLFGNNPVIKSMQKHMNVGGFVEELSEEYAGAFLNTMFGFALNDEKLSSSFKEQLDNSVPTILSIGITVGLPQAIGMGIDFRQIRKTNKRFNVAEDNLKQYFNKENSYLDINRYSDALKSLYIDLNNANSEEDKAEIKGKITELNKTAANLAMEKGDSNGFNLISEYSIAAQNSFYVTNKAMSELKDMSEEDRTKLVDNAINKLKNDFTNNLNWSLISRAAAKNITDQNGKQHPTCFLYTDNGVTYVLNGQKDNMFYFVDVNGNTISKSADELRNNENLSVLHLNNLLSSFDNKELEDINSKFTDIALYNAGYRYKVNDNGEIRYYTDNKYLIKSNTPYEEINRDKIESQLVGSYDLVRIDNITNAVEDMAKAFAEPAAEETSAEQQTSAQETAQETIEQPSEEPIQEQPQEQPAQEPAQEQQIQEQTTEEQETTEQEPIQPAQQEVEPTQQETIQEQTEQTEPNEKFRLRTLERQKSTERYGYTEDDYKEEDAFNNKYAKELSYLDLIYDDELEFDKKAEELEDKLPNGFIIVVRNNKSIIILAEPSIYFNFNSTRRRFKVGDTIQIRYEGRSPHVTVTKVDSNGKIVNAIDAFDGRTIIKNGKRVNKWELLNEKKKNVQDNTTEQTEPIQQEVEPTQQEQPAQEEDDSTEVSAFDRVKNIIIATAQRKEPDTNGFSHLLRSLSDEELNEALEFIERNKGRSNVDKENVGVLRNNIVWELEERDNAKDLEAAERKAYERTIKYLENATSDFDYAGYISGHEKWAADSEKKGYIGEAAVQRGVVRAARDMQLKAAEAKDVNTNHTEAQKIGTDEKEDNVLVGDAATSQRGEQGSTRDAATRERTEDGERTADSAGSIEAESRIAQNEQANTESQGKKTNIPKTEEAALRDALIDKVREAGIDVITDVEDAQRVLDEANGKDIRQQKVYHGSGADFDAFDFSHMGEGTGNKAFGWGGYVSESKGVGMMYVGEKAQLYLIEIPDDNGSNYLHFEKPIGGDMVRKVKDALYQYIVSSDEEGYSDNKSRYALKADIEVIDANTKGGDVYGTVSDFLGGDKQASEFLSSIGFVGISYNTGFRSGETTDNTRNYVIFNENDLKIVDKIRFFRTADGNAYGFTVGGKIYIDQRIATADTPIHEYAHLWASAMQKLNPNEWENIVKLMKGTPIWEEVKRNYPELTNDNEIADEVLAFYSGSRGAERLREEHAKILKGNGNVVEKVKAINAIKRVKEALKRFWKNVAEWFGIHFTTAEEVADKVLSDLLNGVNPTLAGIENDIRFEENSEEAEIIARAKSDGTYMKAPNGKKSNLSPRQWVQVRTKAFKDWFGDWENDPDNSSKVVDENGEPMVVYHGSGDTFTIFSPQSEWHGNFFSSERSVAESYSPTADNVIFEERKRPFVDVKFKDGRIERQYYDLGGIYNVYLDINKPLVVDCKGKNWNDIHFKGIKTTTDHISDYALKQGYDGVIFINLIDGAHRGLESSNSFVAFNSNQIKSATDNVGTFDQNNPDIRYQFVGEKGAAAMDKAEEATIRLDNLAVARDMEKAGKDAKDIKLATGWERGAEGKWRYEILDGKFDPSGELHAERRRLTDEEQKELDDAFFETMEAFSKGNDAYTKEITEDTDMADIYEAGGMERNKAERISFLEKKKSELSKKPKTLDDYIDNEELFAAYPELRDLVVEVGNRNAALIGNFGAYLPEKNIIRLNDISLSTLSHEVQHAIQYIEGFALGGSKSNVRNTIKKNIKASKELSDKIKGKSNMELYRAIMGEVEARNVQSRLGMSAEERRRSLAIETENVERKDQIFLEDGLGVSAYEVDKKANAANSKSDTLYRIVDDKSTIERLDAEPKIKAYRAMQVIDGRLYSPMAAKIDGKLSSDNPFDTWTEAEETVFDFTPEQIAAMEELDNSSKKGDVEIIKGKLRYRKDSKTGKGKLQFHLVKGDGTDLWAAYNPYIHNSLMMLNDQFTSAYKRPNIVVVEVEIPESELTSGYRANLAKDAVGIAEWKAGPVASQLPSDMSRKVILSRWSKVKRIVPYSEVADNVAALFSIAEQKNGKKMRLPIDSFHPELRKELEKRGFEFEYGTYTKEKTDKKGNLIKAWDEKTEEEKQQDYNGAAYIDDAAIKQLNEEFGGKWIRREGVSTNDELSQSERQRMAERVNELAEKLQLDNVDVVTDASTLEGKQQRAKGFYSKSTDKITIVIPNNSSVFDAEQTLLHEAVAHYGLRQLFGEHFDTFLDNVFNNADKAIRKRIIAIASKNGFDLRTATEEYLATLAENTEFEAAQKAGWWQKIKDLFLNMLHRIGFEDFGRVTLTDNELRYILWRSYENLANGNNSILGDATDEAKQKELGVGNYAATNKNSTTTNENDIRYRRASNRSVISSRFERQAEIQREEKNTKSAANIVLGNANVVLNDTDIFDEQYENAIDNNLIDENVSPLIDSFGITWGYQLKNGVIVINKDVFVSDILDKRVKDNLSLLISSLMKTNKTFFKEGISYFKKLPIWVLYKNDTKSNEDTIKEIINDILLGNTSIDTNKLELLKQYSVQDMNDILDNATKWFEKFEGISSNMFAGNSISDILDTTLGDLMPKEITTTQEGKRLNWFSKLGIDIRSKLFDSLDWFRVVSDKTKDKTASELYDAMITHTKRVQGRIDVFDKEYVRPIIDTIQSMLGKDFGNSTLSLDLIQEYFAIKSLLGRTASLYKERFGEYLANPDGKKPPMFDEFKQIYDEITEDEIKQRINEMGEKSSMSILQKVDEEYLMEEVRRTLAAEKFVKQYVYSSANTLNQGLQGEQSLGLINEVTNEPYSELYQLLYSDEQSSQTMHSPTEIIEQADILIDRAGLREQFDFIGNQIQAILNYVNIERFENGLMSSDTFAKRQLMKDFVNQRGENSSEGNLYEITAKQKANEKMKGKDWFNPNSITSIIAVAQTEIATMEKELLAQRLSYFLTNPNNFDVLSQYGMIIDEKETLNEELSEDDRNYIMDKNIVLLYDERHTDRKIKGQVGTQQIKILKRNDDGTFTKVTISFDNKFIGLEEFVKFVNNNFKYEDLRGISKAVAPLNAWLSRIYTILSPLFSTKNFFRDLMVTAWLPAKELNGKNSQYVIKNFYNAFNNLSFILKMSFTEKSFSKKGFENKLKARSQELFEYYLEYSKQHSIFSIEDQIGALSKENKTLQDIERALSGKENKFIKFTEQVLLIKFMQHYAELFENLHKFSAYVTLRKLGYGEERSAQIANNATLNYDRSGSIGRQLNAIIPFAKAALGGFYRTKYLLPKYNPKGFLQRVITLAVLGVMQGLMYDPDDDDISEFARKSGMVFGSFLYPLLPEELVIVRPVRALVIVMTGKKSPAYFKQELMESTIDLVPVASDALRGAFSYNPLTNKPEFDAGQLFANTDKMTAFYALAMLASYINENKNSFGKNVLLNEETNTDKTRYGRTKQDYGLYDYIARLYNSIINGVDIDDRAAMSNKIGKNGERLMTIAKEDVEFVINNYIPFGRLYAYTAEIIYDAVNDKRINKGHIPLIGGLFAQKSFGKDYYLINNIKYELKDFTNDFSQSQIEDIKTNILDKAGIREGIIYKAIKDDNNVHQRRKDRAKRKMNEAFNVFILDINNVDKKDFTEDEQKFMLYSFLNSPIMKKALSIGEDTLNKHTAKRIEGKYDRYKKYNNENYDADKENMNEARKKLQKMLYDKSIDEKEFNDKLNSLWEPMTEQIKLRAKLAGF